MNADERRWPAARVGLGCNPQSEIRNPQSLACRWSLPLALLLTLALGASLHAQAPADYFRQNCISCHTIGGGRLTGPDLKDVAQRKDRDWLARYLANPKAMIDSGDPYAAKLLQDARGVIMPTVAGMTTQRAQELLDLIAAESRLPKSQFVGMQISDRPFTAADVALGKAIFFGQTRLAGGGPACYSCHTFRYAGGLGGGRLAPDLTLVFERLQGRKNLATWLTAPATPTMGSVFKQAPLQPNEVLALAALFEQNARIGGQDDSSGLLDFFLFGLGGAGVALVIFDAVWRRRFRSVRRAMVDSSRGAL